MSPYEDWKLCLLGAMFMLVCIVLTGYHLAVVLFWLWYYLALAQFSLVVESK